MPQRSAIYRPLSLAAVLALGAGVLLALAVFWTGSIVSQFDRPEGVYRSFIVSGDGTPFMRTYDDSHVTCETLEGKALDPERRDRIPSLGQAMLPPPQPPAGPLFEVGWSSRIVLFADPGPPSLAWYFLHDGQADGAGYFAGFDVKTKRPIGYLGARGFRPDEPPADDWFPMDGRLMQAEAAFDTVGRTGAWGSMVQHYRRFVRDERFPASAVFMLSGNRLLEVDFAKRSVRTILEGESLLGVNLFQQPAPFEINGEKTVIPRLKQYLAARSGDRVLVVDPQAGLQRAYILPEKIRRQRLHFCELDNRTGVALLMDARARAFGQELVLFDPAGKVLRQAAIPSQPGRLLDRPSTLAWGCAAAIPVPIVAPFVVPSGYVREYLWSGEVSSFARASGRALAQTWPQLLIVFLLSASMAWLCYRRQKRFALPHTARWVAFVFLGGVPGLIGYLLHRRWPPRVACPACAVPAPRDRDACAHCGAEFGPPARKGIEVVAA